MDYPDKVLTCQSCSCQFIFSSDEQEFFHRKELTNEPKRCPNCRVLARATRLGKAPDSTAEVPCAGCGQTARVPFRPKGDRPVYCNTCFKAQKQENNRQVIAV